MLEPILLENGIFLDRPLKNGILEINDPMVCIPLYWNTNINDQDKEYHQALNAFLKKWYKKELCERRFVHIDISAENLSRYVDTSSVNGTFTNK